MPLIALHNGKRLDITQEVNPRRLRGLELVCPMCDGQMIVKAGGYVTAHFAHKAACTSTMLYHPESFEHISAKVALAEELRRRDKRDHVVLEWYFKDINRIADILVKSEHGQETFYEVHEIQLASISVEELEQRTTDYEKLGIEVYWYFGNKADTPANREWCTARLGGYYLLTFASEIVTLRTLQIPASNFRSNQRAFA